MGCWWQNRLEGIQNGHGNNGLGAVVPQEDGVWDEAVLADISICLNLSMSFAMSSCSLAS